MAEMTTIKATTVFTLTLALLLGGSHAARAATAPTCVAPRVLIVLDRSSSMVTGKVGKRTKWKIATEALSTLLTTHGSSIEFGLMVFPHPDRCGPGKVKVTPGVDKMQAIMDKLANPPPLAGNWTPMAQSLKAAARLEALQDSARASHVLLITDGWQWCSPYNEASRFAPVVAVNDLTDLGIKTHVVGFGASVDALTLNKMAETAKTKVGPGCKVNSSNPSSDKNCYFQANDPGQLLDALQRIAKRITDEVCDGLDNDCDGQVDEELGGPFCSVQQGVCSGATRACDGVGGWAQCSAVDYRRHGESRQQPYEPSETRCDGLDNDCDGTVDEGCACQDGQTRPCGSDVGACRPGTQTCAGGRWSGCAGEALPVGEICDGEDNDCDGTTDGPTATCAEGGLCIDGVCALPVEAGGGCDCRLGDGADGAGAGALLLLGLLLALRRRHG